MENISPDVLENPFSLEWIDRGSFGEVYKFADVAIKVIRTQRLVEKETKAVVAEIALHSKLSHPNIVQYLGCYHATKHICIVLEFAEFGSLKSHLSKLRENCETLSDVQMESYTEQILTGLIYLHSQLKPIIHRDLRSPNVLMFANDILKIADFGISKELNTLAGRSCFSSMVGNAYWQAPELIKGNKGK